MKIYVHNLSKMNNCIGNAKWNKKLFPPLIDFAEWMDEKILNYVSKNVATLNVNSYQLKNTRFLNGQLKYCIIYSIQNLGLA